MPELPEVETVRRGLAAHLPQRRIAALSSPDGEAKWAAWRDQWAAALVGTTFTTVRRRAKFLILDTDADLALVVHLRMTGSLTIAAASDPPARFHRIAWHLDGGTDLRFADMRRFGTAEVLTPPALAARLAGLGHEPLDPTFDAATVRRALGDSLRRPVKAALLDQTRIAGLGNIYADESLHRAGIYPGTAVGLLTDDDITRLTAAITATLADGVARGGTTFDAEGFRDAFGNPGGNFPHLFVYHRHGQSCRTCGRDLIVQMRLAGRSTHYCPTCQPLREAVSDKE